MTTFGSEPDASPLTNDGREPTVLRWEEARSGPQQAAPEAQSGEAHWAVTT